MTEFFTAVEEILNFCFPIATPNSNCSVERVMKALREELVDRTEAKEMVLTLVSKGFRIEPKLLARMLGEMERFSRNKL